MKLAAVNSKWRLPRRRRPTYALAGSQAKHNGAKQHGELRHGPGGFRRARIADEGQLQRLAFQLAGIAGARQIDLEADQPAGGILQARLFSFADSGNLFAIGT